jgi:hypothetical protein
VNSSDKINHTEIRNTTSGKWNANYKSGSGSTVDVDIESPLHRTAYSLEYPWGP